MWSFSTATIRCLVRSCTQLRTLPVQARCLSDKTKDRFRASSPVDGEDQEVTAVVVEDVVGVGTRVDRAAIDQYPEFLSILEEIRHDFQMPVDSRNSLPDLHDNDDDTQHEPRDQHHQHHRVPSDLQEKFIAYRDEDADVIVDTTEEDLLPTARPRRDYSLPTVDNVNLNRGVSGVYDIDELVAVLRFENAQDICAIELPKELSYADYLVIASGRSARHVKAIVEFVVKMYKKKKSLADDFVKIQGEHSKDWMALDMGNVVLHVMLPEVRERYDIESLWSVGEKYDRNCQRQDEPIMDALQRQLNFLQEMEPSPT